MGRKNKGHRPTPEGTLTAPRPQALASSADGSAYLLMGSGYQSASASPMRGYLWWPTTDTRRQLSSLSRNEIARRIQWLCKHFGFCRRLCWGMARMLGFLTPQPGTSDEEWNDLAFDVFLAIATSCIIYDRAGKFDWFTGQIQDNVSMFRDGDCLDIFTETASGRARFASYEAHQIKNGPDQTDPWWFDGVRVGDGGQHMGYSVRDGEDPTQFTAVDARDCLYMGNFDTRGEIRATSILQGAVMNMIDVVETRGFTKHGLKAQSRIGTVIETALGGNGGPAAMAPFMQATYLDENGNERQLNMEHVVTGAMTPQLKPGQSVKVVSDNRPSPNSMEFEKALLKDCCYHADLSYERVCDIAGLTGPGVRILNADEKRWVQLRHYTQAQRCHRRFVYILAKELKAGRLRQPVLGKNECWWSKIEYIGMPVPDIDGGRTAQATLINLQSGLTTWMEEAKLGGLYWKRRCRQAIREVIFAKAEVKRQAEAAGVDCTVAEVFPARFAIINAQPGAESPDPNPKDPAGPEPDPDESPNPASAP